MTNSNASPHPLKLAFAREYPGELASYVASRGADAVVQALDGLPPATAAAVVAALPHGHAMRVLAGRNDDSVVDWVNAASLDQALALLLHLAEERRTSILDRLSSRRARRTLKRLVIYPVDTIGALVNPAAMRLNVSLSLAEAVAILRDGEPVPEQSIWLVDEAGIYLGLLDLGSVLASRADYSKLREFLVPVRALRAETVLVAAGDFNEWQSHPELPIIDSLNHLLGSVSRTRLTSALAGSRVTDRRIAEDVGDLARQYFRIMGVCLGDLFSLRGRKR